MVPFVFIYSFSQTLGQAQGERERKCKGVLHIATKNVVVGLVREDGMVGCSPDGAQGLSRLEGTPGEGLAGTRVLRRTEQEVNVMVSRPRPVGAWEQSPPKCREVSGQSPGSNSSSLPAVDQGGDLAFWERKKKKKRKKRNHCF